MSVSILEYNVLCTCIEHVSVCWNVLPTAGVIFFFNAGCNLLRNCHGFVDEITTIILSCFFFSFIHFHPDKKNCNFIWFIQRVQSVRRHNAHSDNQYFPDSPYHPPNILKMKLERLILYAVQRASRKLNENVNERCCVSPKLHRGVFVVLNLYNSVFVAIHRYSMTPRSNFDYLWPSLIHKVSGQCDDTRWGGWIHRRFLIIPP